MKILITGGTGFIGYELAQKLSSKNHEVIILTRDVAKAGKLLGVVPNIEFCSILDQIPSSTKIDHIINLAGARIAYLPWTRSRRQKLINSRIKITEELLQFIKRLKTKPQKLLNASSTGWYGYQHPAERIDESYSFWGHSFIHELCYAWESKAFEAREYGVNVKIMRFGMVLDLDGGWLYNFNCLFKYGLAFYIGEGNKYISWVHKKGVIEACLFLLKNHTQNSIFNVTAPFSVTNKEFAQVLGRILHRPVWLKLPEALISLPGDIGKELLLSNINAVPQNLLDSGFEFRYQNLDEALNDIYHKH